MYLILFTYILFNYLNNLIVVKHNLQIKLQIVHEIKPSGINKSNNVLNYVTRTSKLMKTLKELVFDTFLTAWIGPMWQSFKQNLYSLI